MVLKDKPPTAIATVILHVSIRSRDNKDAQDKMMDIMKAAEQDVDPTIDYWWFMESVDHPEDRR